MVYIFFFNDTATTEIYTLSLHDALPISDTVGRRLAVLRDLTHPGANGAVDVLVAPVRSVLQPLAPGLGDLDRKSTRLNSSHANISYAVFCLKKKHTYVIT